MIADVVKAIDKTKGPLRDIDQLHIGCIENCYITHAIEIQDVPKDGNVSTDGVLAPRPADGVSRAMTPLHSVGFIF
jgi:hypothetical protein